jgi:hypothetical protein
VAVTNGLFTTDIDFGASVFAGQARWLQVYVGTTPLNPRQRLAPTPAALSLSGPAIVTAFQMPSGVPAVNKVLAAR